MDKNIIKKDNVANEGTSSQLLGLANSACENLPEAVGASNETTKACMDVKIKEIGVIQKRMESAKPEEMPALIEQNEAAYRALSRKDIHNKIYGFAITATVCGCAFSIAKYMYKAVKLAI